MSEKSDKRILLYTSDDELSEHIDDNSEDSRHQMIESSIAIPNTQLRNRMAGQSNQKEYSQIGSDLEYRN